MEPKAADALQSQNDFSNLAKDVRLFVPVIEDAIRKAGGRIADDLVAARLHLDTLQSQLAEYVVVIPCLRLTSLIYFRRVTDKVCFSCKMTGIALTSI